jgi:hypothetical protein
MMKEAVQTHTENVHVNENALSNAEVYEEKTDASISYLNTTDKPKLYRWPTVKNRI